MDFLKAYRLKQKQQFKKHVVKKEQQLLEELTDKFGYSVEMIEQIKNTNCVIKIQQFFRKFRLSDKEPVNECSQTSGPIIKFRQGGDVYALPYPKIEKNLALMPENNPAGPGILNPGQLKRMNRIIRELSPYKINAKSNFFNFTGFYNGYTNHFDDMDVYKLFESKGETLIRAPKSVFDLWGEINDREKPGLVVYALEIINNNPNNFNRAFATFDSVPNHGTGGEFKVELPVNVYKQLNVRPDGDPTFKMRIVRVPKATKIYIRCLCSGDGFVVKDYENTFTSEINRHKIISVGQIIVIENSVGKMIPFRVEKTEPSNVVETINVNVKVDFLPALAYESEMDALKFELNSNEDLDVYS